MVALLVVGLVVGVLMVLNWRQKAKSPFETITVSFRKWNGLFCGVDQELAKITANGWELVTSDVHTGRPKLAGTLFLASLTGGLSLLGRSSHTPEKLVLTFRRLKRP